MALSRLASLRLVWALRVLLALVFAAAAFAKLSGQPMMVQVFEATGAVAATLGPPAWLRRRPR